MDLEHEIRELRVHVEVMEERLSRLAGAFKVLLDHLDTPGALEIQDVLAGDFKFKIDGNPRI